MSVRPAKTQISLGIRHGWSDQTGRMPRLLWVFAGRSHFVGFVMSQLIRVLHKTSMTAYLSFMALQQFLL